MPTAKVSKEEKFTKEQIVNASRFYGKTDILNALLKDGESYSLEEVDKKIDTYMKAKVK